MPYCVRDFYSLRCLVRTSLLQLIGALCFSTSAQAIAPHNPTTAQPWSSMADMVFRHLSTSQGLPQFSATVVAQDGEGYIWVGTQGGLARWDGYRFRNYLPIPNDPTSLPDNYVMSMYNDKHNRLWVGTNGGGVARYDDRTDSFVRVPLGPTGISHVTVSSMTGDGKDGLWLATRNGLDHFQPDTGVVQHYRHDPNNPDSLPSNFVRTVALDPHGILWVGTTQGLVRFDVAKQSMRRIRLPMDEAKVQRIVSLGLSADGKLWIGTFDSGAFFLDTKASTNSENSIAVSRLQIQKTDSNVTLTGTENIHAIQQAGTDEIWLGTYGKGVVIVNTKTLETKSITHEPNRQSSLADNAVWYILRDRSGLIWVGSQRGLSLHDPSSNAFLTVYGGENRRHGLGGLDFFSVHGFQNGDVWVGSQNNGISMLKAGSAKFNALAADDRQVQTSLPQSAIYTIFPTTDEQVFIGTEKGLYQSQRNGTGIKRLKLSPRNPVLRVATLLQLGDQLLIGGPEGIWLKDLKQVNEDKSIPAPWAVPIANKFVTDMQIAPDGAIWVATLQDGVYRYDPTSGELLNIAPDPANPLGLRHRNVSGMLFDSRGWLWVAMQGGGIDLLRNPSGRPPFSFEHFGKKEKMPNELVNKILEDKQGNIWASTDEGFARIDTKTMQLDPFVESDGVPITGYWSNSGGRAAQGELIFGGVGGLTIVRSELVKTYRYHPPIVVTNIQLGGKTIAANHVGLVGQNAKKIIVQPDANSIVVEFSALDFSAPERNRYAYRLEGYDKNWVETDYTRRLAAYTNLPPGEYRLLLRGSNRVGDWNDENLVLIVKVLPAWFQTWWAYALYVLLLILLIVAVVRWRLWRLNEANQTLELLVQKRTRELEQSRKMLEEQSLTDHLTGLRNRRFLNLYIGEDIARVNRAYQALDGQEIDRAALNIDIIFMMVDIDHFKSVNDEFGHAAGDLVLTQTTAILLEAVREADTIIRWGGEEFLIVARHANYLEAEVLAERIRTRIAEHVFTLPDGQTLQRTCSIGLTTYPFIPTSVEAFSWEQVVDIADQCLYAAKHGGRNAWVGLFLLGNYYAKEHITNVALEVEQQIAQGHILVKSSLPDASKLDWSHGRGP
ncbi:diguanylate cyclase [Undibacterium sp. LX15W]|uniref:diguanylate cyclase n=2 Tax=Undibacterium flavidum TaxID=2762297 RepID=A0ABR6YHF3_9BURK|nr:diguanylate cyclase [Undibacterium flavidum]